MLTLRMVTNCKSDHIFLQVCPLLTLFLYANVVYNSQLPGIDADFRTKSFQLSQDPEESCGIGQQLLSYRGKKLFLVLGTEKESLKNVYLNKYF